MAGKPSYEELEQRVKELEEEAAKREQAERSLKSSEAGKLDILDSTIELVTHQDRNLKILWANKAAGESVGSRAEDLVGRYCYEIWEQRSTPCTGCPALEAMRTGHPHTTEIVSSDGRTWLHAGCPVFHENGNITGVITTTLDITEGKRAKQEREKSEKLLSSTFNALHDLLLVLDRDLRVVMSNWKDHDYVSEEARQGHPHCYKCLMHRDTPCEPCHALEVFASGQIKEVEHTNLVDGKTREIRVFPIFDDDGNVTMVVEHVHDITERKQAEEERKRLEAQFREAQKMEAIVTLAGGIAHDFNNLLTTIQGNASLMLFDVDSTHPHYELLKTITRHVRRGAKLTAQLLGYARKGRYEVKPISLNRIVEETSYTFGRTHKEIAIHRELNDALSSIDADQSQIEQVVLNLYTNASAAMPGGGTLTLKTMNVNHYDIKDIAYDPSPGSYVLLTVTDTGTGMDQETQKRIFEPFFTTQKMGRGTGLGLATVFGIIKGHRGYIHVDSEKGRGTTFRIYFPASNKEIVTAIRPAEHVIEGSGTILLVDDETPVLDIGVMMLEKIGYTVLKAKGGREAVEVYEANNDTIDLVVLDMIMPDMGGGLAYDRMKEINPDVKVLLSSGYSVEGEATEILKRGCDGFIQKPFNIKELSGKIKELFDMH